MTPLWDRFQRDRDFCTHCRTLCAVTKDGRVYKHNALVQVGMRYNHRAWLECPGSRQPGKEAERKAAK